MSYKTYSKTRDGAKPLCRIEAMPEELSRMIESALSDVFDFTSEDGCAVVIEAHAERINLTSANGSVTLPRPISITALTDAAKEIADSANAYYFSADEKSRTALLGDTAVTLTDTEFRLYSAILENRGRFTSREELSMAVWGRYDPNLCTVYISYLRRKLDSAFGDGTLITARGKGYRLRDTNAKK